MSVGGWNGVLGGLDSHIPHAAPAFLLAGIPGIYFPPEGLESLSSN